MNSELLERLLHEDESATLDFKQAQYPFEKASDRQKSELLKDILAFANAWRRTDAYILIGVQEVQGGRSKILGVAEHLPEASLQQFVNKKTNRPISFSYEAVLAEGKQIGVICVANQERPVYLLKDFGKLREREVYIRRGSSTDVASPDEIARIGAHSGVQIQSPLLSLEFADAEERKTLGQSIAVHSLVYTVPNLEDFPDYVGSQGMQFDLTTFLNNEDFYRDYAQYISLSSALVPLSFMVCNLSATLIRNGRIEIIYPEKEKLFFLPEDEFPEPPVKGYNMLTPPLTMPSSEIAGLGRALGPTAGDIDIVERSDHWDIAVTLGDIQPKAYVWSEKFYVFHADPGDSIIEIEAFIYMDEGEPLNVPLAISFLHDREAIDSQQKLRELMAEDELRQRKELEELFGSRGEEFE